MHIDWGIWKKQGNVRPVFWYDLVLTDEEKTLNPRLENVIETEVPVPLAMFVNGGKEQEPADEMLRPSHLDLRDDLPVLLLYGDMGRRWVILPWRGNGSFFEEKVREAVDRLREAMEEALKQACESQAFEIEERVEMSEETKQFLAPYIAKHKMFRF
ncbi:MAG: hypothetical protein ACOC0U_00610 [Desulfovibrionales bacterium]